MLYNEPSPLEVKILTRRFGLPNSASLDTYLAITNRAPEELSEQLRAEARRSIARELVLESVAEQLEIEVGDDELASVLREQGESEETIEQVLASDISKDYDAAWPSGRERFLRILHQELMGRWGDKATGR